MNKYELFRSGTGLNNVPPNLMNSMLVLIFLALGIGSSYANSSNRQASIDTKIDNASLFEFFEEVQLTTEYVFVYGDHVLNEDVRIPVNLEEASIDQILQDAFLNTGLEHKIADKKIVIKELPKEPIVEDTQQTIMVSGTITETGTGIPIPGANILEKGTNNGTMTDFDGNYQIEVPQDAILSISYMGFATQEIEVSGRSEIDIVMEQDAATLEEVVVVGYGIQKKSSLTSAISTIRNETIDQQPESSIGNALAGRMAGVTVSNSRNRPGDPPSIRVRGLGSISAGNAPLVVIDGFPGGNLGQLSVNDIESIEVLKDASSAAIYGSRGASGVILVTTKRGAGKTKINLNSYYGFSQAILHDDWLTGEEWHKYLVKYQNREFAWAGGDTSIPVWGDPRRPETYQVNPLTKELPQTIWQNETTQLAPIQNHNLSISGGNDKVRYYVSGTYMDEQGVIKTASYKRYSFRANVDVKVNDVIDIGMQLNPSFSKTRRAGSNMVSLVKYPPFVSPHRIDGMYPRTFNYISQGHSGQASPYTYLFGTEDYDNSFRNIGRFFVNLQLLDGLSLKSSIGTNLAFNTSDYWQSGIGDPQVDTNGNTGDSQSINLVNENVLNYSKTFNEVHEFGGILGASYQRESTRSTILTAVPNSFNNEAIKTLNNAIINPSGTSESRSEWGLVSYFSRVNYAYDDRYLLSASFRADGSSRFGPDNKWGYFPSASAAWRISEEAFMQPISSISELKLRASYGVTGNFNIGNFQYLGRVSNVNYSPGNSTINGLAQTSLQNQDLSWEKTIGYGLGLELGMFNNRLNFVFDYYDSRTLDMLYNVNTPGITGFSNTITNTGEIKNTGVEIEITTRNLVEEFTWSTSFNLSHNKNEVTDLGDVDERINSYWSMDFLLREGEPMFSYYGYKMDGIFQNEEQVANTPSLPNTVPGNPVLKDINGDGKITPDDKVILGNFQPDVLLGMSNEFSWKQFDLSLFLQASLGAEIINFENQYYEGNTLGAMRRSLVEDQWWSEEDPGDGQTPAASLTQLVGHNSNNDFYVEDASFLNIKSLNLGYTLSPDLAERLGMSSLRVYTSMSNLLIIKNKDNHAYNPEGTTRGEISGINSTPGLNLGSEPLNRTIVLGVNVGF